MNSPITLPPLPYPQMPGNDYTAADMRAYAEQAVREALAALKIDERAAFEHWASDDGENPTAVERSGHGYRLAQIQTYWVAWQARASLIAERRCEYCDGTGDVHSLDGEWRGICTCPIGRALASAPPKENPNVEGADIQHP